MCLRGYVVCLAFKKRVITLLRSMASVSCRCGAFSAIVGMEDSWRLQVLKLGMIWFGFFVYLLLYLLAYELLKRFVPVAANKARWGILSLALLTSGYGMFNANQYQIYEVDIPMAHLAEEVTIFHAPDLHLGPYRGKETLKKLVSDINRLQPDFVLLNGDLVDGLTGLEPGTLELLKEIQVPVYFTGGNHDAYVDIQTLKKRLT